MHTFTVVRMDKRALSDHLSASSEQKQKQKKKAKVEPNESTPEAERSNPINKNGYRERSLSFPSPPPELPRDTTEFSMSFRIPVPGPDRKRVLVSGGQTSLTVDDVTQFNDEKRVKEFKRFVEGQFDEIKTIEVVFELETNMEHAQVEREVKYIINGMVRAPDIMFRMSVDCLWMPKSSVNERNAKRKVQAKELEKITDHFLKLRDQESD